MCSLVNILTRICVSVRRGRYAWATNSMTCSSWIPPLSLKIGGPSPWSLGLCPIHWSRCRPLWRTRPNPSIRPPLSAAAAGPRPTAKCFVQGRRCRGRGRRRRAATGISVRSCCARWGCWRWRGTRTTLAVSHCREFSDRTFCCARSNSNNLRTGKAFLRLSLVCLQQLLLEWWLLPDVLVEADEDGT